ncbi:hypothetical protein HK405_011113 [Cladochytrium tenue]|nr:hypothetical protein HK405_011113 [Cladochytrium tenue]
MAQLVALDEVRAALAPLKEACADVVFGSQLVRFLVGRTIWAAVVLIATNWLPVPHRQQKGFLDTTLPRIYETVEDAVLDASDLSEDFKNDAVNAISVVLHYVVTSALLTLPCIEDKYAGLTAKTKEPAWWAALDIPLHKLPEGFAIGGANSARESPVASGSRKRKHCSDAIAMERAKRAKPSTSSRAPLLEPVSVNDYIPAIEQLMDRLCIWDSLWFATDTGSVSPDFRAFVEGVLWVYLLLPRELRDNAPQPQQLLPVTMTPLVPPRVSPHGQAE